MTSSALARPLPPLRLADVPPPEPDPLRGHVPCLDALRGVAILLVMMLHFVCLTDAKPRTLTDLRALKVAATGWCGVSLFFLLSGFLITGILHDGKESPRRARNFFARRCLRIFPVYYAILIVGFLLWPRLLLGPTGAQPWPVGRQLWAWFYGLNWGGALKGQIFEPLGHFWSLAVEEHFYLVWPFVIWKCARRTAMGVCLAAILAAVASRWALLGLGIHPGTVWQYDSCHLDALCLGALLALAIRGPGGSASLVRPARYVFLFSALLVAAVISWRRGMSHIDAGFQAFGMVPLLFFFGSALVLIAHAPATGPVGLVFNSPLLRFFGKYSYGLYVWHGLLFYHFAVWFPASAYQAILGAFLPAVLQHAVLATLVSLAVALVSYHCFEKHFLKMKSAFTR
jgi:peptidoglycan/LPS O-acetylase OafA/YrhL